MPFDKSRSYDVATPIQYSGAVEYGGSKRPWWVPLFWFIVIAVIVAGVLGSMGCASAASPTAIEPVPEAPALREPILSRPLVISAVMTTVSPRGKEEGTCDRVIVVNPETMAGMPGIWFNAYPIGPEPETGCDTGHPTGYPKWSVTPAARLFAYHRPFDASQGWFDPDRFGNWANLPSAGPGVYTVSTYNGGGSTTSITITVTAPKDDAK